MKSDHNDLIRFQRQILLPEVGIRGQKKIQAAKVLLIGAGGLGSSAGYYLAAAGIGTLGIVDDDRVEMTNLNRQILHSPMRIGELKVSSARGTLIGFNESVDITVYSIRIQDLREIIPIVSKYDLVIDCTDNIATRFLINEACLQTEKPWVYGAVSGFEGQAMTIVPGHGPCYRCLYLSPPPVSKTLTPVIGVSPGVIGIIQAAEALKYILGIGDLLTGRLLYMDLLEMTLSEFRIQRNENCQACGNPA